MRKWESGNRKRLQEWMPDAGKLEVNVTVDSEHLRKTISTWLHDQVFEGVGSGRVGSGLGGGVLHTAASYTWHRLCDCKRSRLDTRLTPLVLGTFSALSASVLRSHCLGVTEPRCFGAFSA
ncbi:UNVERIFIED_CONTAM: hypothetical protein FKN15_000164 [Acipenser sinensis]